MIAEKLGYDYLLLGYGSKLDANGCCTANLGYYSNYYLTELKANGISIKIKFANAKNKVRRKEDMYAELVGLLYKVLENGGTLSDGQREIDAMAVPEFMIECDLHGYA